jgi:hypothetical protein
MYSTCAVYSDIRMVLSELRDLSELILLIGGHVIVRLCGESVRCYGVIHALYC